jgi:Carboxypeptidase regulatory-like domain/TonB-dependent Receptor Plug Domain
LRLRRFLCCSFILFLLTNSSAAQSPTGTISGIVTDPAGATIAGAEVIAVNDATRVQFSGSTNGEGIYVVPNLPPGNYRVQVSKVGFKTIIKPDIVLNVQDALAINFALPLGAMSEIVTIQGGASLVNTESAAVATVVDRQFVENIPLNGRSFQSLIELTPGVVVVPSGSNSFGQFSVNGQRASANSFTVDGVSANFGAQPGSFGGPQSSGNLPGLTAFGTTQSLASVDALQEFKVQTSTYSAEYGRQPGGQVSIVTRSGTNEVHGSAFDYLRNEVFDANDWFADRAGQPKPPERQNDFGGTFGGPVVIPGLYNGHDRTFFFFSYEGLQLRLPQFTLTNVPTLALRQQAAPGIQPILNAFPVPNGQDLGDGFADFSAGYSNPSSLNATSIRVDHNINEKLTLFVRYNKAPSESTVRSVSLSNLQTARLDVQTITIGATELLSPKMSNEVRANYSVNGAYSGFTIDDFGGAIPPPQNALIPAQYSSATSSGQVTFLVPGLTAATGFAFLDAQKQAVSTTRLFNLIDNFSRSFGTHEFKVGIDYRRVNPLVAFNTYGVGATFSSEQQIIGATAANGFVGASIPLKPIFLNFSAYAQDRWRLCRQLTLELGLRWDVNPAPSESNGNLPIAVNEISNLAAMQLAPLGTKEYRTTYNNFAPRVGTAYQLSQAAGHETVLRAGFGVFYDTGNDLAALDFNQRFPYSSQETLSNVSYPLRPSQVTPPPLGIQTGLAPPYSGILALSDPNLKLPYTLQWSLALEQSLSKNQAFTVSYVGAGGRRLTQSSELNLSGINPPFGTIFLTRGSATSDYDALQTQFQRRLSGGLQALVSYSWSHALDDDSSGTTFRVAQRGNAAFDIRHVFTAAATYDIPAPGSASLSHAILGHWFMDTSAHVQSALPVDLVAEMLFDPADGSLVDVRPNVNPGVPFYLSGATCAASNGGSGCPGGRRINPAAFSVPPEGQSGNFGRNQVRGLGAWQQDFALRREFPVHERLKLQFRAEAFNIYNHPNFGSVQTNLTAPNFGEPTNMLNRQLGGISQLYQLGGPRSLQLALKLLF